MKKQDGYAILFMIIIIMMLISIVLFSMLFLALYEFRSVENYDYYQRAYYLALGAREEVLSILSSDWDALGGLSSTVVEGGECGYEVVESNENRKKINIYGKSNLIQRDFEAILEAPSEKVRLLDLKKYALYCNGKMIIDSMDTIHISETSPGIIGITKDLIVNRSDNFKKHSLDVKGDTVVLRGNEGFTQYNSFVDSHLPYCQPYNSEDYVTWLVENFKENVSYINAPGETVYLDKGTFPIGDNTRELYIVQGADAFIMDDCTFEGFVVLDCVKEVYMTSSAKLHGSMLLFGGDTGVTEIQGEIKGNIMLLDLKEEAYFKGVLHYDLEGLDKITPYLSTDLLHNEPQNRINLLKWSEI